MPNSIQINRDCFGWTLHFLVGFVILIGALGWIVKIIRQILIRQFRFRHSTTFASQQKIVALSEILYMKIYLLTTVDKFTDQVSCCKNYKVTSSANW